MGQKLFVYQYLFFACLDIIPFVVADGTTWYIRPIHDTPYNKMFRTKVDLDCEIGNPRHRFLEGACVEKIERNLSTVKGGTYKIDLSFLETSVPTNKDAIESEGARNDEGTNNAGDEDKNVAKKMSVKVAPDADEIEFELNHNSMNNNSSNDTIWEGTEIVPYGFLPGTANFVKASDGYVSGNINSIHREAVYAITTRMDGNYVEVIPYGAFPADHDVRSSRNHIWKFKSAKSGADSRIDNRRNRILKRYNMRRKAYEINEYDEKCPTNVIDIMVAYTEKAMCLDAQQLHPCNKSHSGTIESRIVLGISQINQAFKTSGTNTKLRLVKTLMIDHSEKDDWTTILQKMAARLFPRNFYAARKKFGADLVHMILAKNDFCGYSFNSVIRKNAYSLSSLKCSTGQYSMAHEIGHNIVSLIINS
uniref:Uncharacterized protein n=1 Tax=Corethron hystrix TaxID=216773 RepID=A0A6U5FZG3_9STRA|mmetsp:Transcript_24777/g.57041  ORF Transcript_24777/g.57041 Transcript_24777/m.57041 type:complete len:420 (+) Transcript_24777:190-1449(+)